MKTAFGNFILMGKVWIILQTISGHWLSLRKKQNGTEFLKSNLISTLYKKSVDFQNIKRIHRKISLFFQQQRTIV